MSYTYKTTYSNDMLSRAVGAVRQRHMSLRQAADEFGVPRSTLSDHVRSDGSAKTEHRGRRRELNDEQETALAGYLRYMANQGLPASRSNVKGKVVDILTATGSSTRVNMTSGPSDKWLRSFLSRHGLSAWTAENIDQARAAMSNEVVINEFFDFYERTLDQNELRDKPDRIFNCDESGWTGREKAANKFVAPVDGHIFRRKITTGGHITAHLCVCASGRFLPALIIFQGGMPHKPIEGVPESWLFASTDTGFINADIFYQWFMKCFIPNCGKERPVLLVMDNHESHVSINTIKAAIENDVILVGFPGHTTHILQPLDVKIFGPLKYRFAALCSQLGQSNSSVTIGKSRFPALLRHAIDQATPASVQKAFAVTGLCPVDRAAIDKTQLVEPSFVQRMDYDKLTSVETCPTCGNFTTNPLVAKGIVPKELAKVLLPPPVKPLEEKKKYKKRVERGRVLSTQEMLNEMIEHERLEEEQKAEKRNAGKTRRPNGWQGQRKWKKNVHVARKRRQYV